MNLTEQEFLERDLNRRMLARARQKKFYQKHRPRILLMRKAARIAYRQTLVAIQPQVYQRRPRVVIQNQFIPSDDIILTQDKIIELLKNQGRKGNSVSTYISSIKRYFDNTQLTSLNEAALNPQQIVDDVEASLYRGRPFADNTKKLTYQSIVYAFT